MNKVYRKNGLVALALSLACLAPAAAQAAMVNVVDIGAPASVLEGVRESDGTVWLVKEGTSAYNGVKDDGSSAFVPEIDPALAVGTPVESYYFYFDPDTETSTQTVDFAWDFANTIVAVIYNSGSLNSQDSHYGLAGTAYPTDQKRGLERVNEPQTGPFANDTLTIVGNMISGVLNASNNKLDTVRVLTDASTPEVPIPPAVLLFGSALVGLSLVGRRKAGESAS